MRLVRTFGAGSSPRMRGAPVYDWLGKRLDGIIPAYAGSTSSRGRRTRRERDHPRVCGEHPHTRKTDVFMAGSSPRMRGARRRHCRDQPCAGIIPAYAGSTWSARNSSTTHQDHPRVCGEHSSPLKVCVLLTGSSPRMRGALKNLNQSDVVAGIIPAYAGSTRLWLETFP